MDLKLNLSIDQKSTIFHSMMGVAVGIFSSYFSKDPNQLSNAVILLFTLAILVVLYFATQKIFNLHANETEEKKYNKKWYLSNGAYPYLIFWIVAWIFMLNI